MAADYLRAAIRLTVCYQYLAKDPVAAVDSIMQEYPALADDEMAGYLVEHVHKWGRLDVY
jgi:hypothetical protein